MSENHTQPVRSLEARYYTDPAVYQQELNGILSHSWQYAAHESELKNIGDFVTFSIAEESLFCVRTASDKIQAFYNVCQHRAHQLLEGNGQTNLIVCPYHAWSYELTGELRNGPNLSSVEGFDKRDICLTEIRLENFNGFLFANLDPNCKRVVSKGA